MESVNDDKFGHLHNHNDCITKNALCDNLCGCFTAIHISGSVV